VLHFNMNRLAELIDEEKLPTAAKQFISRPVLKAMAVLWCMVLGMVFSLIVVVRFAMTL
jgi:hypothetical protein